MPSLKEAGSLPSSSLSPILPAAPASGPPAALAAPASSAQAAGVPSGAQRLAEASRALWLATLSLMTAFMQATGPAHRCLLARRIARNFETLSRLECFEAGCRGSFRRLARRWQANSEQCAPDAGMGRGGRLLRLFS